jgi:A/G-specific adenine glycosylase
MNGLDFKVIRIWGEKKNREFQDLVLDWYRQNQRRLPWRRQPTPYRVWISEVMLQQTQVKTVVPYFHRFLRCFPDIATLAAASEEEVMALWAGLGYYSRARNLHRAAMIMAREFGGDFPCTLEEIEGLPGIGRYTAAAIHSIAFNCPQPVVDGNVRRVITRLHAITTKVPEDYFWRQAQAWQHNKYSSDFAQAVMELGALVCKPAAPLCSACPAQSLCRSYAGGIQFCVPAPRLKRVLENVDLVVVVLEWRGKLILLKKRAINYVPGEWSLPTKILSTKNIKPEKAAKALAQTILGISIPLVEKVAVRHSITHHRIRARVFYADVGEYQIKLPAYGNICLAEKSGSGRLITSSLYKKALCSALRG